MSERIVLLPAPDGPTSAVRLPFGAEKRDAVQHGAIVDGRVGPFDRLGTDARKIGHREPGLDDDLLGLGLVRLLRVGERHVVEADRVIQFDGGRGRDLGVQLGLARQVDDLLDASERAERLAHRGHGAECRPERS